MRITGEAVVTERVYRAATAAVLRRTLWMLRGMGAGIAVLGVLILGGNIAKGMVLLVLAGTAGLLLPWRAVSMNVRRCWPALAGPWRYELSDGGLRISTPLATTEMAWPNLPGHADHGDFWLVHTPIKQGSLIVVKAAFSAEDQAAIAHELERRHAAGRAVRAG